MQLSKFGKASKVSLLRIPALDIDNSKIFCENSFPIVNPHGNDR